MADTSIEHIQGVIVVTLAVGVIDAFLIDASVQPGPLEHGKRRSTQSSALVGINQSTVKQCIDQRRRRLATTNVTAIAELVRTTPVAALPRS